MIVHTSTIGTDLGTLDGGIPEIGTVLLSLTGLANVNGWMSWYDNPKMRYVCLHVQMCDVRGKHIRDTVMSQPRTQTVSNYERAIAH
jgi:hypothetical protein